MAKDFSSVTRRLSDVIKDASVTADGDDIVVIGRERGRIRATSAGYDVRFVQRFKFIEGKLASLQIIAANSV